MNRPIRVFFKKTGRAKYISHLDLQRTMQRALKRADLPVWETEGFNPHIYITFALPLSLGIESVYESFDIKITQDISFDEIRDRLNSVLTEDLKIIKSAEPTYKHTEIKTAEYEIIFNPKDIQGTAQNFREFLRQKEIIILKKTKKGETNIDIKPMIELKQAKEDRITLFLPAGNELSLNPLQVLGAFGKFLGQEQPKAEIIRTVIFCANGEIFI
ncbi:MAG: TIGR03936 family radical SAM-associated protein [Oscillospiraceae bacterium]|nr:TIGR03936 family radical SAM-associated protein [Oscillospiraceae bacterium]